jgi:uncharacterized protein (TIGR02391 family)
VAPDELDALKPTEQLDPESLLKLADLHPLVRRAAEEPWARRDYARAVRDAWFALRDALRDRLNEPQLDGTELVNAVGETGTPPRLPLTDYVSATDRSMHRGLVNLLRGVVFFVRHPEAHETQSPAAEGRIAALHCLVVMSLCARYVVSAAAPTAVEDAILELTEPFFPKTITAVDDLVRGVPPRRSGEFAQRLVAAATDAFDHENWVLFDKLVFAHRRLLARASWEEELVSAEAVRCTELVSRDETLELACRLIPGPVFSKLQVRHQEKVAAYLQKAVEAGRTGENQQFKANELFEEIPELFPRLSEDSKARMFQTVIKGLRSSENSRYLWCFVVAVRLRDSLGENQLREVAAASVDTLAESSDTQLLGGFRAVADTPTDFASNLKEALLGALRAIQGEPRPGSQHVTEALDAFRRAASADTTTG